MTESEQHEAFTSYIELSSMLWSNFSSHLSIYLTLLFAYCVVAYTAGSKLSRFQVITVSVMFVIAAEIQTFVIHNFVKGSQFASSMARSMAPDNVEIFEASPLATSLTLIGNTIWQAGIIVALLFMWNARRNNAAN